jgi:hypothetical protein
MAQEKNLHIQLGISHNINTHTPKTWKEFFSLLWEFSVSCTIQWEETGYLFKVIGDQQRKLEFFHA